MKEHEGKIILTGPPRVGKTTVIQNICQRLMAFDIELWGFMTLEIGDTSRSGFELVTFEGYRVPFAHIEMVRGPKVGPYRVDVQAFEAAVLPTLKKRAAGPADGRTGSKDPSVGVIDEIGKMECFSKPFRTYVEELLQQPGCLIISVADHGTGFVKEVRDWAGDDIIQVTKNNRNYLPDTITDQLIGVLGLV